ncbi:hypothetical protein JRQ81_011084 [Phrynocephalus forsythii]|uniref:Death domain-containing protein n=1 Tax=Phrynocephalus forsythii TaxID=171643 RepID=A0A9Q1ARE0_9SAUR|nr:hypothetical protein JRQ81_011084 [Phrynocephalus forsythii]
MLEVQAASIQTVPNPIEISPEALYACTESEKLYRENLYLHDGRCCEKCPPGALKGKRRCNLAPRLVISSVSPIQARQVLLQQVPVSGIFFGSFQGWGCCWHSSSEKDCVAVMQRAQYVGPSCLVCLLAQEPLENLQNFGPWTTSEDDLARLQGQPGRRDNEQNENVDVPFFTPSTDATLSGCEVPGRMPRQDLVQTEEHHGSSAKGKRHLIPANGKDPTEALRQSFETFIDKVPVKQWRRYMRALSLTDNEIIRMERSEKEVEEQQFQMLRLWLEKGGREVTLHTLLNTLGALELRGTEKEVREALIYRGLYIYQE